MKARVLKTSENADLTLGKVYKNDIDSLGFPLIVHSDKSVCWPVTDYLLHRYLWRRLKLGTVKAEAHLLVLFVTFLDKNRIQIENMHDKDLVAYSDFLFNNHKKGQASQVNKNIKSVIGFLLWYDQKLRKNSSTPKKLISKIDGYSQSPSQITVHVERRGWQTNSRRYSNEKLIHTAFLPESIPRKRHPIPEDTIKRLWMAIPVVCKSLHRAKRDELLLMLFECIGARRSEIFDLTVSSALEAIKSGSLTIRTKKQKKETWRSIPIDKSLANRLEQYIKYARAPIIEKSIQLCRIKEDHDALIIGIHGKKWQDSSFNKELDLLASAAQIETPVSPHLYRHKFGTLLAKNTSHLSPAQQRLYIKQMGGWRSDESANVYIHLDWMESEDLANARKKQLKTNGYKAILRSVYSSLARAKEIAGDDKILSELGSLEVQLEKLSAYQENFALNDSHT